MSKKRFVQSVVIRSLPALDKLPDCLKYAEQLWEAMSQRGYGADKAQENARENKDWHASLDQRQLLWFNRFWITFNYKKGRNEASKSWVELGEQSDAEYKRIVEAAEKESQRPLDGQVRKMAQGWLSERRYLDYEPVKKSKTNVKNHLLRGLNAELNGLKTLYQAGKDEALLTQIAGLEEAIKNAR